MNAELGKLKQKVLMRFAESIVMRIRAMGQESASMSSEELISDAFADYLASRLPILRMLAEISST